MIRGVVRRLCLVLALAGGMALAPMAGAQVQTPPPLPFAQLVDTWTRTLDRISGRTDQPTLQRLEIDALREQATDVRAAATASAALARGDLGDTKRLLTPLEPKPSTDKAAPDQPPDSDAVKAERQRLVDQAATSESRVKQCEVIVVRADQLLERLNRLRNQLVIETLLHRNDSPLSRAVLSKLRPQFAAATHTLASAFDLWRRNGLAALQSGDQDLTPLAIWAVFTIGLCGWRACCASLRQRGGAQPGDRPGQRDRTIAAAIDGVGLVLVPILAVWLVGRLLAASEPPPPIDSLLPALIGRSISFLLVVSSPPRRWRPTARLACCPSPTPAADPSSALRRLMAIGTAVDFSISR